MSEEQSSRIRYGVVELASPYYDVYNRLLYFFLVIVYLCAYLFEAGAFKVDALYGYSDFIASDGSAVIQSPCGGGQNIFRFENSFQSIVH